MVKEKEEDKRVVNGEGESLDLTILNVAGDLHDDEVKQEEVPALTEHTAENVITPEIAGMILEAPFNVAACFLGEHWKLKQSELSLVSPSAASVFTRLFGQYINSNPDAYILGFTLLTLVGIRCAETVKKKQEEQDKHTIKLSDYPKNEWVNE